MSAKADRMPLLHEDDVIQSMLCSDWVWHFQKRAKDSFIFQIIAFVSLSLMQPTYLSL